MFLKKLNKFEKVKLLKDLNVNTEDSILLRHAQPISEKDVDWLEQFSEFSIRTFYDFAEYKKTAFFPVVEKKALAKQLELLKKQKLNAIVGACVDPEFSEYAGVMLVLADKIIIEIAKGAGSTVRWVTHEGHVDERHILDRYLKEMTSNSQLNSLIKLAEELGLENVSYEFSYYMMPVGWKKERMIVWEVSEI